ncbi:MAG: metal-dependent hydrolase [Rhizomicrobium sp.]
MASKTQSPSDLIIRPRDFAIRGEAAKSRWWMGGDPVASIFYDVLSASFPLGERFFMDAVRHHRDRAPAALQGQIAAFLAQEALHTREHLSLNRQIEAGGYDLGRINSYLKSVLGWARSRKPVEQLAATAALEHFTAILAHALLSDPRHLDRAPQEIARLWRWHAIEEIEHKAVAYDTFLFVTRDLSPLRRWGLRAYVMMTATVLFFDFLRFGLDALFAQDGIRGRSTWVRWLHFAFVRPGILRRVMGSYLTYYLPQFHPWRVDDRALTSAADRELQASYARG